MHMTHAHDLEALVRTACLKVHAHDTCTWHMHMTHAHAHDLEALVRTACLKALPTDEEITAAGFTDAGAYLPWLAVKDEEAYVEMVTTRGVQWGDEPPQPTHRCVDHLLSIIMRKIESAATMDKDSNLAVSDREVRKWWRTKA